MKICDDTYPLDTMLPLHVNTVWMRCYNRAEEHFHWHSFYEISCVLDGQATCVVNGNPYSLQKGDLAIFNRDEIHGWQMMNGDIQLLVVTFLPSLLSQDNTPDNLQVFHTDQPGFRNILFRTEPMVSEITACLHSIRFEWENDQTGRSLMIRAEMLRLLIMLERSFLAPQPDRKQMKYQRDLEKIRQALVLIDEHYMEHLTLEQVANSVYLSKNYFSTLFHRIIKERFQDYLIARRLSAARQLLMNTNLSVAEIASACGFQNTSNFYKQYAKYYGERPRG